MKVLRVLLVVAVVLAVTLFLGCPPIMEHLDEVYKVYGTVTVYGSDPPAPIGSVEVFVGNYQYSELTNYYGDYELELGEGSWTINFKKEGYEDFSAQVTVGPETPRVRQDAEMVWIAPPFDITGHWKLFATEETETNGILTYFVQSGDTFQGMMNEGVVFTGTVDGSVVTLEFDFGGPVSITGMVQSDGTILFEEASPFEKIVMEPLPVPDGAFELSGLVDLVTDTALAGEHDDFVQYTLRFGVSAAPVVGAIEFRNETGLGAGSYAVENGEIGAFVWIEATDEEQDAEAGSLTVNADEMSGSFDLTFPDGDSLAGSFVLQEPDYMGATVTVTSGSWGGTSVATGTTSGLAWYKEAEPHSGGNVVTYIDETECIQLIIDPQYPADMAVGTYTVPADFAVELWMVESNGTSLEDEAVSGELVITGYAADGALSGHFTGMQFTTGTLSGSFSDVPYLMNELDF